MTSRLFNLHDEIVRLLPNGDTFLFTSALALYATAYQPQHRDPMDQVKAWLVPLALGQTLPSLPLGLTDEICLRVDLEAAYDETCRKLRMISE